MSQKILNHKIVSLLLIMSVLTSNSLLYLLPQNTAELSSKYPTKYQNISQIDMNNLEEIFTPLFSSFEDELFAPDLSSSQDVFVIFHNTASQEEKIAIIRTLDIDALIQYNYRYIPVISVKFSIPIEDVVETIGNSAMGIVSIQKNHKINYFATNPFQDSEDLTVPNLISKTTNYPENWWLNAIGASDVNYTGSNVKIAVIDTGISVHPDFFSNGDPSASRIIASRNFTSERSVVLEDYTFDDYGHGTHCAGIAAGNGYLSEGAFRGVAPEALLINAKISNSSGFIEENHVVAAIEWCIDLQADIISMSFGDVFPEVWNVQTLAIQSAVQNGIIAFASAGNSGPGFYTSGTPASGLYSISVGATDQNNNLAPFSSWGPTYDNQIGPEICAPGVNIIAPLSKSSYLEMEFDLKEKIYSTKTEFDYIPLSGTSMACPIAAGAAALLLEAFPHANPEVIRGALILGAYSIESTDYLRNELGQGAGIVNVTQSLEILKGWNQTQSDINKQAILYPRAFPYSPFDIIQYPGESIILNYSLMVGEGKNVTIEFPDIQGIEFELLSTELGIDNHGIIDIPIFFKIRFNASEGNFDGNISIYDSLTSHILDEIAVNISVKYPKGKIYFDSYHGLNDGLSSNINSFNQIEMYALFQTLISENFQVLYNMQNWSPYYNSSVDASIISREILSDIEILVLQTPIIPYSSYEIQAISDFYHSGGSILFLGTLNNLICLDSLSNLFHAMGVDLQFEKNLANIQDYALYTDITDYGEIVLNQSAPIFNNVDNFYYEYGTTLKIGSNMSPLAWINDDIIVAEVNPHSSNGKCVFFGDYHFLTYPSYISTNLYPDLSKAALNLFDYLNIQQDLQVNFNFENNRDRKENIQEIQFQIIQQENSTLLSELTPGDDLNATIAFPNGTIENLNLQTISPESVYYTSFFLNQSYGSRESISVHLQISHNDEIFEEIYEYIFISNDASGEYAIDNQNDQIDRIFEGETAFAINSTQLDYFQNATAIVYPNSLFSRTNISQYNSIITEIGNKSVISFDFHEGMTTGKIIIIPEFYLNESTSWLEFYPPRLIFTLENYNPVIDLPNSNIDQISFDDTVDGDYIIPIEIKIAQTFQLVVDFDDDDDVSFNSNEFSVSCILIPVLVYNGLIRPLFPVEYPHFSLEYDEGTRKFKTEMMIPLEFQYNSLDSVISTSSESNYYSHYVFAWINVKDPNNGNADFPILLIPYLRNSFQNNWIPILFLYGVLGLVILSVHKFGKKPSKPRKKI